MSQSVKKNYLYNLTYQLLTLLLPLITTPYVSRVLGAQNLGIYSYTLSVSAFFILFGSLGIAMYGQREIAFVRDNREKRSSTFWEIVILRAITMLAAIVIFYIAFVTGNNDYRMYYRILLLELIGNVLDISWFFQGLEDFRKTVTRNMAVKLLSVICIFVFVRSGEDLPAYFLIYVLSILAGNLSLWLYLPKLIFGPRHAKLHIFRHFKPTVALFIPQIAVQVYTILDRTMIGAIIADKSEVGYYDQAQKIVKMLLTVVTSLGTVLMPRIAHTYASGDMEKVHDYMRKSFRAVFFLSFPLIFGIISVSDAFVPAFFGAGYDKVKILMPVISPILFLIGMSNVTGTQYLLPTMRQKEYTISVLAGSGVNFCMNALMIPHFGAFGASIGTVIAETSVTCVQIFFTRHDFQWMRVVRSMGSYLLASFVMFAGCLLFRHFVPSGWISVIGQVFVGAVIYSTILILTKDPCVHMLLNAVKKRERKK
ncbi:MAG: flippase [Lachnospiraceae bacterium]|jgi:O-antigen/teichoic acid export membrane protein|nr:flippase [Lachnospiraceae bacterium]MCH4030142.1 flippase [Lachnospiraceae bacterium]MCH4070204.1 flippase [Lachnospiraceae bacterium]MCH4107710.1 flippase [Lachnospiraceae bacterium]MCI1301439.1 flippase [Lachnospiraceae bacterium]